MDKKEKYYKFIIDNMVSKTEVYYDSGHGVLIKLPFDAYSRLTTDSHLYPIVLHPSARLKHFGVYVKDRYGVTEEEYGFLFSRYLIELKKKVDES